MVLVGVGTELQLGVHLYSTMGMEMLPEPHGSGGRGVVVGVHSGSIPMGVCTLVPGVYILVSPHPYAPSPLGAPGSSLSVGINSSLSSKEGRHRAPY